MMIKRYDSYSHDFTFVRDRVIRVRFENASYSEIPKFAGWIAKLAIKTHPVFMALGMTEEQIYDYYEERMIRASQNNGLFRVIDIDTKEYIGSAAYEDYYTGGSDFDFISKSTGNASLDAYRAYFKKNVLSQVPAPKGYGELFYLGLAFTNPKYRNLKLADVIFNHMVEKLPALRCANIIIAPLNQGTAKMMEKNGGRKIADDFVYANSDELLGMDSGYKKVTEFAEKNGFPKSFFECISFYNINRLPRPSL